MVGIFNDADIIRIRGGSTWSAVSPLIWTWVFTGVTVGSGIYWVRAKHASPKKGNDASNTESGFGGLVGLFRGSEADGCGSGED